MRYCPNMVPADFSSIELMPWPRNDFWGMSNGGSLISVSSIGPFSILLQLYVGSPIAYKIEFLTLETNLSNRWIESIICALFRLPHIYDLWYKWNRLQSTLLSAIIKYNTLLLWFIIAIATLLPPLLQHFLIECFNFCYFLMPHLLINNKQLNIFGVYFGTKFRFFMIIANASN